MPLKFPDALRQTRGGTINTRAGTSAVIRIYSGSQPADADTAASGTLLATLTGNAGGFGTTSSEGVLTASAVTSANAVATGTAGWFRVLASDGTTVVFDGGCATSGEVMTMPSTSITSGQPVQITSIVITEGQA
jgi:hypothetical protein